MSQKQMQRLVLCAAACIVAATLSCSRQSRPALQQSPAASSNNSQAPNAPQQLSSPQQATAVLVAEPGTPAMPAPSGSQQPDRVFSSGHTSAVTAIAFSPNRRWAATGGEDKAVRIWELATASELRVLTGHTDRVSSLAFSPDGQRLASASADGTMRLWDPATGTSLEVSNTGSGPAEQVVFSPDGRFLAVSAGAADEGGHSIIEIHDGASGAKIRSITVDWNNAVPLLITPDDRLFSSGGAGEDGEIEFTKVWDIRSGRELKSISLLVQAFSPDGQWGASLDYHDGLKILLWDVSSGRRVRTITAVPAQISRVAFTPDGTRIAASGENGAEIKFYETNTGKEAQTLPFAASALAFSGDGKWLGACFGSSVKILDLSAGRELETLAGQLAAQDLIFSTDGKMLITGDASLGLWDTSSGKLMHTIEGGTQ